MTTLFDILLWPLRSVAPGWGLLAVSAVSGVLFLLLYGRCSNQAKLREVKKKIGAAVLETILFRRDFGLCLRAQGRMFVLACRYLLLAVPPLLVLAIPGVLILAQLNLRYNARPLREGEHALLKVQVQKPSQLGGVSLQTTAGLHATAPVRVKSASEVWWRLDVRDMSQPQEVTVRVDGKEFRKPVAVGTRAATLPTRNVSSWRQWLLYPGERLLDPQSSLVEAALAYPAAEYQLFGFGIHWIVTFLVVSLASGLVTAKIFHVEI